MPSLSIRYSSSSTSSSISAAKWPVVSKPRVISGIRARRPSEAACALAGAEHVEQVQLKRHSDSGASRRSCVLRPDQRLVIVVMMADRRGENPDLAIVQLSVISWPASMSRMATKSWAMLELE